MTVQECIEYMDAIEPNAYTAAQKAGWLSECEGKVYTQLFLVQPDEFTPIHRADDRMLALPLPHDRLYPRYLQAMIHYANGDYDRYANSMAAFNEAWGEANRWFGGDFDVTDRLRNRRVALDIPPEPGSRVIIALPAGCAIAAGRIDVLRAFTADSPALQTTEDLPAGSYTAQLPNGTWVYHAFGADIPEGTRMWLTNSAWTMMTPGSSAVESVSMIGGKEGTVLSFSPAARLWLGEPEHAAAEAPLTEKRRIPLPLLAGGDLGITFGPGIWDTEGAVRFTGRLLIPDERWTSEDRYRRGRDAGWRD